MIINRLNDVLASLIHVVQAEIGTVSPLMRIVNKVTLDFENYIVDIGIRLARERAWNFAAKLNATPRKNWDALIVEHDQHVASLSQKILTPGCSLHPALWIIRRQEKTAPHEIISGLAGEQWHKEAHEKARNLIGTIHDPHSDLVKRETHLMPIVKVSNDETQK